MADIFGYENNTRNNGQVASANFASFTLGSGPSISGSALIQSVSVKYGQAVEEVAQVGSPQVYWLPGRPSGSIEVSRLVGSGGFLSGWSAECGTIDTMRITSGAGKCGFAAGGTLSFSGGIIEQVTINLGSDKQTIAEGVSIKIASLSK